MCRIDRISSLLDISPWTGQSVSYTDTTQISVVNFSNILQSDVKLTINNKTYWQAGTYSVNVPNYVGTVYQHIPNL